MGIWGTRLRGRDAVTGPSSALPADRLSQLMIFVERAAAPTPAYVAPDLPSRLVPALAPETAMAAVEPAPAVPVPAPAPITAALDAADGIAFPDPIRVDSVPVAGKHRRLLSQSA